MNIRVKDDIDDALALDLVTDVVQRGKIMQCKDQRRYCYETVMICDGKFYKVRTSMKSKHPSFTVSKGM